MTLSLWRYAHLALALCASAFLIVASITGAILAVDAVGEKLPPYKVGNFDSITLTESLSVLSKKYDGISEISVDHNQFVTLTGFDSELNEVKAIVNPATGEVLGEPQKKSALIEWTTALHRSLFLHETGRWAVGIVSFLLFLIATSGVALILQRQGNAKRFFGKITKEGFAQFYHIVFGRLALIPILLISLTGTFLTLERFNLLGQEPVKHTTAQAEVNADKKPLSDFPIFKSTRLAQVKAIEFPFSDDPEEYFLLKLRDREVRISQSGSILSEVRYDKVDVWADISLALHTGRVGIAWAVVLFISCLSILFFIYSGFVMTIKRRSVRIKNRFKADDAKIILLVGSENGSTIGFADAIHRQLLATGHKSFLAQPNDYTAFAKAEHLILLTSTHGLGDPPSNADKLKTLVEKHPQQQNVKVSVVGFGSQSYPDFCGFARKAYSFFYQQPWADMILPLHTVNEKSVVEFVKWVKMWSETTSIPLATTPALYVKKPKMLKSFTVVNKQTDGGHTFILMLKPTQRLKFQSGDLLAIYPKADATERLYSIGKVDGNIQLVVRLHENGLGSGFLNSIEIGSSLRARVVENTFHLPEDKAVVMIANGSGIAPFLGMAAKKSQFEKRIYCGFRQSTPLTEYYYKMVSSFGIGIKMAFSREGSRLYVMDLIKRDAPFFAAHLKSGGVVMICGSLVMQRDVEQVLDDICKSDGKSLSEYKSNGQLLTDCY